MRRITTPLIATGIIASLTLSALAYHTATQEPPHLELNVTSTHQEGAWLRVESAHEYTWNGTERSHTTQRLHIKGTGEYVEGEYLWVKAQCGTSNIYTVNAATRFVTAVHFTTKPCPSQLDDLLSPPLKQDH